ncbi:transglycosylase domain-containing protein [Nesterenkonia flava]|uniref:Transglycosylase domain-containing protein n=1 Tax=Nesterenkonia flava TaxID=469799 RepID=A0ABU1FVY2_9MICC|nr:transglycosylase domain-containing protein [Nesterenkonia flava]MDR5712301.1 transglycosylase domain-containing protein [Nesterenkonia flava]
MASGKSPLFDTATTVGKIMSFLGVSALCGILAAGLIFPLAATGGAAASAGSDLLEDLPAELREEPLSVPSTIYASDGETEIATFYDENRQPVEYDQISQAMKDAIVSIEDERFYEHGGVDARGLGRALVHNITSPTQQGASTITQQYVNNVLINADYLRGEERLTISGNKTYGDKLREMKLAVSLEQEMTKEEILEGYLNIVLLGGRNYGVEAAAQYYWGIPASELNIQQAAVLAGMVQSPNAYNPEHNPEASKARRDVVLGTMLSNGFITQEEYDEAVASDLGVEPNHEPSGCIGADLAPYFCDYVVRQILADDTFGETEEDRERLLLRGGLNIVTTLDPDAQAEAEEAVYETVVEEDDPKVVATLTSLEPGTGDILSMAQSTQYDPDDADDPRRTTMNFNVDYAWGESGGFPVGSTLKPFVAAAWIEEGGSMDDVVDASVDEYEYGETWEASCMPGGEITLLPPPDSNDDTWELTNVGENFLQRMTIDYGLYYSVNTATVATAHEMDLCAITDVTNRLGITEYNPAEGEMQALRADTPSFVLGAATLSPMALARAYAAFAADGVVCQERALVEITDGHGTSYPVPERDCEDALDPDVAAQVNDTMINIAEYPSNTAGVPFNAGNPPFPMAGKTGTSNEGSNTWFAGSTEGMATVAHVGNWRDLESLRGMTISGQHRDDWVYGSTIAAPMWYRYMNDAAADYPTGDFRSSPNSPFDDRRGFRYNNPTGGGGNNNSDDDDDSDDDD